jgi:hypothetical protein
MHLFPLNSETELSPYSCSPMNVDPTPGSYISPPGKVVTVRCRAVFGPAFAEARGGKY